MRKKLSNSKEAFSRITKIVLLFWIFFIATRIIAQPDNDPGNQQVKLQLFSLSDGQLPENRFQKAMDLDSLHVELTNVGDANGIALAPFYEVNHSYYNVYWDMENAE